MGVRLAISRGWVRAEAGAKEGIPEWWSSFSGLALHAGVLVQTNYRPASPLQDQNPIRRSTVLSFGLT